MRSTNVEGIFCIEGDLPGKTYTILGGVHGNEQFGIDVVQKILEDGFEVTSGTLYVGFGNPMAIDACRRFLDHDLNRCFDQVEGRIGYEVDRARELMPFLEKTDVLIDLHSTMKPSKPFMCCPGEFDSVLKHFPIETVIHGKGLWGHGKYANYVDTYVIKHGGVGITLETGQVGDGTTIDSMYGILQNLVLGGEPLDSVEQTMFHAYENIVADEGFAFSKEWKNFEEVKEGEIYAISKDHAYDVDKDSIILFPKSKIVVGDEACIILEKVRPPQS